MSDLVEISELTNKVSIESACDIGANLNVREGIIKVRQN